MDYDIRIHVHPLARSTTATFPHLLTALLHHPLGWQAHGNRFHILSQHQSATHPVITITLAPQAVIDSLFPSFQPQKLSVCNLLTKEVFLNEERWLGVYDDNHSGLSLPAYRAYMVNHEIGHALNLDHATCPGPQQLSPIMVQQTLGTQGCLPNPFPR
jgi:hypothetical protein